MIDEKGRLFGKINIIDLAVVVILLAVILGSLYKFGLFSQHTSDVQKVEVTLLLREVSEVTVESLHEGDLLTESTENLPLGIITKKEVHKALKEVPTPDGQLVLAESPNKYDVTLTVEGNLQVVGDQVFIGRRDIKIGRMLNIKTARSLCVPVVIGFEVKS